MLNTESEKSIHIRISQLNDYINVIADMIEEYKLIPDFNKKVKQIYQKRLHDIYNLEGEAVTTVYSL